MKSNIYRTMTEDFELLKLSYEKNGGLSIVYSENYVKDGMDVREHTVRKSNLIPHKDLVEAVDAFKEEVFQTKSYSDYMLIAKESKFLKLPAEMQGIVGKLLVQVKARIMKDMKITGITLGGEDDHRWVIVSGSLKNAAGMGGGINSTNIRIEQDNYGWEQMTLKKVDTLHKEVNSYLQGEKSKTPHFFNEPDTD